LLEFVNVGTSLQPTSRQFDLFEGIGRVPSVSFRTTKGGTQLLSLSSQAKAKVYGGYFSGRSKDLIDLKGIISGTKGFPKIQQGIRMPSVKGLFSGFKGLLKSPSISFSGFGVKGVKGVSRGYDYSPTPQYSFAKPSYYTPPKTGQSYYFTPPTMKGGYKDLYKPSYTIPRTPTYVSPKGNGYFPPYTPPRTPSYVPPRYTPPRTPGYIPPKIPTTYLTQYSPPYTPPRYIPPRSPPYMPPTRTPTRMPPTTTTKKRKELVEQPSPNPMGTYHAFVRKDNNSKWVKVTSNPKPYNMAFNKGLMVADNTVARTVKLKRVSKTDLGMDDPFIYDQKFDRRKTGSKIPGQETIFVEKTPHLIDTIGEKQGLKASKYLKQRSDNAWGF
jgi:hypothetical protein